MVRSLSLVFAELVLVEHRYSAAEVCQLEKRQFTTEVVLVIATTLWASEVEEKASWRKFLPNGARRLEFQSPLKPRRRVGSLPDLRPNRPPGLRIPRSDAAIYSTTFYFMLPGTTWCDGEERSPVASICRLSPDGLLLYCLAPVQYYYYYYYGVLYEGCLGSSILLTVVVKSTRTTVRRRVESGKWKATVNIVQCF